MQIPKQTSEIFELLSKGQFICHDSAGDRRGKLYKIIEEQYDELYAYFEAIDFILEHGNDYFFFARKETRADLERKIEQAYRWIDIVDFFKTFNHAFSPGFRFCQSDVEVQLRVDINLRDKLDAMRRITEDGTHAERVRRLIIKLTDAGYAELENEISGLYKVVASYKYIEELIVSINISEEFHDEISQ